MSFRKETEEPGEPSRGTHHKDERALGARKNCGFPIDWNCQKFKSRPSNGFKKDAATHRPDKERLQYSRS
jgi:hypothetical protein